MNKYTCKGCGHNGLDSPGGFCSSSCTYAWRVQVLRECNEALRLVYDRNSVDRGRRYFRIPQKVWRYKLKQSYPFYDPQYKCWIQSKAHEDKLMKLHGHVDFRDTPGFKNPRLQEDRKRKKWQLDKGMLGAI